MNAQVCSHHTETSTSVHRSVRERQRHPPYNRCNFSRQIWLFAAIFREEVSPPVISTPSVALLVGLFAPRCAFAEGTRSDIASSNFQLESGDGFIFLSDGVVEAQPATGELFALSPMRQSGPTQGRVGDYTDTSLPNVNKCLGDSAFK